MSIQALIEKIARTAMVADAADAHTVADLHGQFEQLLALCPDDATSALRRFADDAVVLLSLLMEDALGTPDVAFQELIGQITEIQNVLAVQESRSSTQIQPTIDGARSRETRQARGSNASDEEVSIDRALLEAWIASCETGLSDLEATILSIETDPPNSAELVEDAARGIHTLKGECGVLSLHDAQRVLHETESLIDDRLRAEQAFPAGHVLVVVDWLRSYVDRLADDPRAPAVQADEILQGIALASDPAPKAPDVSESIEASLEDSGAKTRTDREISHAEAEAILAQLESEHALSVKSVDSGAVLHPSAGSDAPSGALSGASVGPDSDEAPVPFPDDLAMDENLNDFLCEAREHLNDAEAALLELESSLTRPELIDAVFRAFHTIKGVAVFMNITAIVELAHDAESLLDRIRSGQLTFTGSRLNVVLRARDQLEKLVAVLEGAPAPSRSSQQAIMRDLRDAAANCPANTEVSNHVTDSEQQGLQPIDEVDSERTAVEDAGAGSAVAPAGVVEDAGARTESSNGPDVPVLQDVGRAPREARGSSRRESRVDQTVKVSTARMDSLVTLVGELVIAHEMVAQDPAVRSIREPGLQRNLVHVEKIIRDLQEVSMSLRMVTVKGTFQKMARIVRDVALKSNKRITLVMEGEDVELDRTMVDEIADPLVHMVRNSCDHGIETAVERRAAGKPAAGVLVIRAYHKGGRVIIEVEDDGRGLNRDRILQKAAECGLVATDRDGHDIPDADILNLIFRPGFSTAKQVTNLSGRGVGMDVVRRNIESLRGSVSVDSTPGQGTIMRISVPLTMAIIDGMIVRVGLERFILPTLSIEQSFRPRQGQVKSCHQRGEMVDIRGSILPVYRLTHVFDIDGGQAEPSDALLIVVESGGVRFCLMVDDILGQQQVVIKSLGADLVAMRGVSGGAILGDGRVALILDLCGVLEEAAGVALAA